MEENENTNEKPTLWSTKVEDMTVGDAFKINGVVMAVMASIPVAFLIGGAVKSKISTFRQNRKDAKLEKNSPQELPPPTL